MKILVGFQNCADVGVWVGSQSGFSSSETCCLVHRKQQTKAADDQIAAGKIVCGRWVCYYLSDSLIPLKFNDLRISKFFHSGKKYKIFCDFVPDGEELSHIFAQLIIPVPMVYKVKQMSKIAKTNNSTLIGVFCKEPFKEVNCYMSEEVLGTSSLWF